jgi:hypothetical protein
MLIEVAELTLTNMLSDWKGQNLWPRRSQQSSRLRDDPAGQRSATYAARMVRFERAKAQVDGRGEKRSDLRLSSRLNHQRSGREGEFLRSGTVGRRQPASDARQGAREYVLNGRKHWPCNAGGWGLNGRKRQCLHRLYRSEQRWQGRLERYARAARNLRCVG